MKSNLATTAFACVIACMIVETVFTGCAATTVASSAMVSVKKVKASLVTNDVVVLEFEPAFDETSGKVVEYQAFFSTVEPMDSVLSVNASSCCMDAHGKCQSWTVHKNVKKLTCLGLRVGVSYRANILVHVRDPNSHACFHAVYKPVQLAGADMQLKMPGKVTLTKEQYDRAVAHATNDMVSDEARHLRSRRAPLPSKLSAARRPHIHKPRVSHITKKPAVDMLNASGKISDEKKHKLYGLYQNKLMFILCVVVSLGVAVFLLLLGWRLFDFIHNRIWTRVSDDFPEIQTESSENVGVYEPLVHA